MEKELLEKNLEEGAAEVPIIVNPKATPPPPAPDAPLTYFEKRRIAAAEKKEAEEQRRYQLEIQKRAEQEMEKNVMKSVPNTDIDTY